MAEKILCHDSCNVTVYVTLHDTVSGYKGSQAGCLEKGCQKEEIDIKIVLHVSDCLGNSKKVGQDRHSSVGTSP